MTFFTGCLMIKIPSRNSMKITKCILSRWVPRWGLSLQDLSFCFTPASRCYIIIWTIKPFWFFSTDCKTSCFCRYDGASSPLPFYEASTFFSIGDFAMKFPLQNFSRKIYLTWFHRCKIVNEHVIFAGAKRNI